MTFFWGIFGVGMVLPLQGHWVVVCVVTCVCGCLLECTTTTFYTENLLLQNFTEVFFFLLCELTNYDSRPHVDAVCLLAGWPEIFEIWLNGKEPINNSTRGEEQRFKALWRIVSPCSLIVNTHSPLSFIMTAFLCPFCNTDTPLDIKIY